MRRFQRGFLLLWVVLATLACSLACSLVVDFDRSKIHDTGETKDSGARDAGTGGRDAGLLPGTGGTAGSGGAGTGGAIKLDASVLDGAPDGFAPDGEAPSTDAGPPPPECDVATHEGCAKDELCCASSLGPSCRKTSLAECEKCGKACPAGLATACADRACECVAGAGKPCSGKDLERFCVAGPDRCVECGDATDCAGRLDGKLQCVAGVCAQCDPSGSGSGCAGAKPTCNPKTLTCKACTANPDDCAGALVCTPGGACGGCASSASDCHSPTSPICDGATTQCRGCTSNGECSTARGKPYCIDLQRCSVCVPTTELGCTTANLPDCRLNATGDFECQGCTNSTQCANKANKTCDPTTGACVECVGDADCKVPGRPLCDLNVCVPCDTSALSIFVADFRCLTKPGGAAACSTGGASKGQCTNCDPIGSGGCGNNQLCCEAGGVPACVGTSVTECTACGTGCNPLTANRCNDRGCGCGTGNACAGTGSKKFCAGSPGACVECRTDIDCASAAAPLCENGACVGCDAATSANSRCAVERGGTGVCATSGTQKGHCAACDPTDHEGCTATQLCCEASGAPICQGESATNQCTACATPCAATVANGCANRQCTCGAGSACSGTGASRFCTGSPAACVECKANGDCTDPSTPFCQGSTCRACQTDAECATRSAGASPLCEANGACAADAPCATSGDCSDPNHSVCVDLTPSASATLRCRRCDPGTATGCSATQTCSPNFDCTP